MSFAGSPLRQSRRVDQQTFMHGEDEGSSPPRGHTRSIPLSFAYGAPDLSPPKNTSPGRERAADAESPSPDTSPAHEPAAVRYARLKQRNQAHIITQPPVPRLVTDTSVIIASAFNQAAAASTSAMSYRRSADPGDDAHATGSRRLAVPPSRLQRINAKNKAAGRATVSPAGADSDGEDASFASTKSARAKSPFNALAETVARAVSPIGSVIRAASPMAASVATYVLREGRGADDSADGSGFQSFTIPGSQPSRQSSKTLANSSYATNNSASYDYAQEEEQVADMEADAQSKRNQAKRRAGRVSLDDKAWKPTRSDNEASDEEFTDDDTGKKRRRKKKKDSGHLTLPTIGYDKNKKKKPTSKRRGKGLLDDDAASGSDRGSVAPRSVRGSVPPVQVVRDPEPEPEDSQIEDTSGQDYDMHDDSAQLSYEEPPQPNGYAHLESQTAPPRPRARWFGRTLGAVVRALYDLLSSLLLFVLKLLGMVFLLAYTALSSVWNIAVQRPYDWLSATSRGMSGSLPSIAQVVFGLVFVYLAYFALSGSSTTSNSRGLFSSLFGGGRSPVYVAPDIPASNVQDVIERLRVVEAALDQTSQQLKRVVGRSDDLAAKLVAAQAQVETETRRASEAEEKLRGVTQRGIADMKVEVASIKDAISHAVEGSEALVQLEQRVATAEADVKHLKSAPATVVQPSAPAWWNNVKPGTKPITIKASDGTDVTGFIGSLVERAVGRLQRDTVGRPDYAQHSSGGRVVPGLTTPSAISRQLSWRRRVVGFITGYGYAQGHPPVVALHSDISLGHCWPFEGPKGSLGVVLARPIVVDAVTIDHVPRELAFDAGSNRAAPRTMDVWGLVDGKDNQAKVRAFLEQQESKYNESVKNAEERNLPPPPPLYETLDKQKTGAYVRLASFEYDINSPQHIQTFAVRPEVAELDVDFGVVVLQIHNNWGHKEFTCLYRFRVHGTEREPAQIAS